MNGLFDHMHIKLAVVIVCVLLVSSGCSTPSHEGFAIYLTRGDIPPAQLPALSHIDIADRPVIATNDIVWYNAETHEMTLTTEAYDRISSLEVPVRGKSFAVCVDRQAVYCGAFWTPISSMSFDGITIWKPLGRQGAKVIKLELGYPSSAFYGGTDPRNNREVMESLRQAGKLINIPPATAVDMLPHSMKGYELYSWQENGQWHFTLITGTNRNKTLDEIISPSNVVTKDEWVQIHEVGVDAIKKVLSRLPQGEYVFWLAGMREQTPQGSVNIELPAAQTVDTIKEHAGQCGLNFMAETP